MEAMRSGYAVCAAGFAIVGDCGMVIDDSSISVAGLRFCFGDLFGGLRGWFVGVSLSDCVGVGRAESFLCFPCLRSSLRSCLRFLRLAAAVVGSSLLYSLSSGAEVWTFSWRSAVGISEAAGELATCARVLASDIFWDDGRFVELLAKTFCRMFGSLNQVPLCASFTL
jgi:hypothetical protein